MGILTPLEEADPKANTKDSEQTRPLKKSSLKFVSTNTPETMHDEVHDECTSAPRLEVNKLEFIAEVGNVSRVRHLYKVEALHARKANS